MENDEIEIIDDVESSGEVNTVTEPNTISNDVIEEKKEESVSSSLNTNDAAFNVVMNDVTKAEEKVVDSNNNIEEKKDDIVPNNNVEPQEVVSETVVNNNEGIKEDNTIVDETPSSFNNEVELNDNNSSNNGEVINIKETSTIQNEAGTAVIGEINGDNVTTTNSNIPNNIDVNAKASQIEINNKKKVSIKTKNQKFSSVIIIILVLLIIFAIGYFGYTYYINNNVSFEIKNVSFEVGDTIPTSASYYVVSSKSINDMEYNVDLSNISNEVGDYSYTVTYKGETKTGTITLLDSKGPIVKFKEDLMFAKNTEISKEMLVSSCEDNNNCSYEISGPIDTTVSGNQEVVVIAKDDNGNTTEAKTNITIIGKSLVCKNADVLSDDGTYNTRLEDVFYFDDQDNYISSIGKKVVTYVDYGSYFTLLNNEEIKNQYNFDRKTFSYWVINDLLYKEGTTLSDIKAYYENNSYTCE